MCCTLPHYLIQLSFSVLFFITILQTAVLGITNRCCLAVQIVVGGTENSVVLQNLNSLTEYEIAVFAVYRSAASDALRGSEITRESYFKLAPNNLDYRTFQITCVTGSCPSTRFHCRTVINHKPHAYFFFLNVLSSPSDIQYVYFLTATFEQTHVSQLKNTEQTSEMFSV